MKVVYTYIYVDTYIYKYVFAVLQRTQVCIIRDSLCLWLETKSSYDGATKHHIPVSLEKSSMSRLFLPATQMIDVDSYASRDV